MPLRLDEYASAELLKNELDRLQEGPETVEGPLFIEAAIDDFEKIRESLLMLRSMNLSPLLVLRPSAVEISSEELELLINYFRHSDQLTLHNILCLFPGWLPVKFQKELEFEAKMELKWFQEWSTANQDQRLSRYPGLPWRSYMRKVIGENFDFALTLLRVGNPAERDETTLENLMKAYLKAKKKAICFFPKKWGRLQ